MILPAFGVVSEIIRPSVASCTATPHGLQLRSRSCRSSSGRTMFTVGMPLGGELFFMYAMMLIAIRPG